MPETITITRKIGRNRGKPRLWIEGKALLDAGLTHGARWNLHPCVLPSHSLEIALNNCGKRRVAGTPDRPIIDISGGSLDPLAKDGVMPESVTLTYQPGFGFIAITPNHEGEAS